MATFYTRSLQDLPKLTVDDVHRMVDTSSLAPTSKREKGFKFYISSYISNYEVSNKDRRTGEVCVRATCFRSMRKGEKPHQLRIILKDSSPVELIHSECSCVAGSALCNHTVALLYQSAHYSQLGIPAVPPVLSCTESEQRWHKPRTAGVKPGPADKMVILSARPKSEQRMTITGVRSTLYKAYQGVLPDLDALNVSKVYENSACAPLITTMGIGRDVPLVDSAFGKVPVGCVLSYQQPPVISRNIILHKDAPPTPLLPVEHYHLEPSNCMFVPSEQEQLFLQSLSTTWDMAHSIEAATRDQSMGYEWHQVRRPRLTSSRFREVCHVRGETSADLLADRILRGTPQTAAMKRGLEMEAGAVRHYCQAKAVNYSPCGFVIHPDAPWLGSSPDGVIYDPTESNPFGLVEVKCPNVRSYVDCAYLRLKEAIPELSQHHKYYWQVQGQLLVTGLQWCDFVVFAEEDLAIQRIYKDSATADMIRERADHFFFHHYMPRLLKI